MNSIVHGVANSWTQLSDFHCLSLSNPSLPVGLTALTAGWTAHPGSSVLPRTTQLLWPRGCQAGGRVGGWGKNFGKS